MRKLLGSCEYKWTHAETKMEHMWVMRELGQDLYKQCIAEGFEIELERAESPTLPGDTYCKTQIWVTVPNTYQGTLFALTVDTV
jgi:hypothetical protein